jgi:2-keto-4-pentenoate hydratase/2-oxohepta-3-ene-1,7-dioic acid hydratase in catechol pathway
MVYFTNPYGLTGTGAAIPAAAGSQRLDYELEVAAVVGREGANVDVAEAEDLIVGYCILNDWSARDIQGYEVKFQVGPFKTKDWAMTTGPFFVTKDEIEPFRKGKSFVLDMKAFVNGRQYSKGNLSDMHWSFAELVAYSSRGTWVKPGDHIASGTVGTGCILELSATKDPDEYPWLTVGDEIALEVDGLGRIVNRLVGPPPIRWGRFDLNGDLTVGDAMTSPALPALLTGRAAASPGGALRPFPGRVRLVRPGARAR